MNDSDTVPSTEQDRNHRQAIEYGKDLARIYAAEKERRKELETAYRLLDAIFNSIPDGLLVIDDACIIRQANPALNTLLGLSDAIAAGRHLNDLPIGSHILPLLEQIKEVSFGSMQTEIELTQPRECVLLANIAPLRTETLDGWVIVLHDHSPGG